MPGREPRLNLGNTGDQVVRSRSRSRSGALHWCRSGVPLRPRAVRRSLARWNRGSRTPSGARSTSEPRRRGLQCGQWNHDRVETTATTSSSSASTTKQSTRISRRRRRTCKVTVGSDGGSCSQYVRHGEFSEAPPRVGGCPTTGSSQVYAKGRPSAFSGLPPVCTKQEREPGGRTHGGERLDQIRIVEVLAWTTIDGPMLAGWHARP